MEFSFIENGSIVIYIETTRQFEIAFKMIDEDKSDYIDLSEFSKVQEAVTRQRDHAVSPS